MLIGTCTKNAFRRAWQRSRPIHPCRKALNKMKKAATKILPGAAWAPFPGPSGNPVLDRVALHDPVLHYLN